MRAPDDDGAGAGLARHRRRALERAQREPRSGQARAVPGFRGGAPADQLRLARFGHCALVDLGEIRCEQCEPVRRVSEQVGVEKNVGDVAPDVGAHAGAIEQCARESAQVIGAIADRLCCGIHAGMIGRRG